MLTHEQQNALLDLWEQCRCVAWAWEQQEASERDHESQAQAAQGEAEQAAVEPCWNAAIEGLTRYYNAAVAAGVPENDVMSVLFSHLPDSVSDRIEVADA